MKAKQRTYRLSPFVALVCLTDEFIAQQGDKLRVFLESEFEAQVKDSGGSFPKLVSVDEMADAGLPRVFRLRGYAVRAKSARTLARA